ncbi:hypothetical protein TSTA_085130 [Talaromyces stipitatus ATCC 10500]|uniref:Clr5 domain-containing protein n=1 Tax=Talaromyces stipitatus (strain ATCC 10500 / CBS 375.48 / QM 6759 / NRRL 1006) TaxID=441959 RepID=B8M0I5_TALSN|nr:uncharacterized protein TSTA_085130 [Talaromyces stipitatus ATCC 10500]EED21282.1 hypothetical protein TSTA_085130 [Talaromyces stipitatus ATCC 10500]
MAQLIQTRVGRPSKDLYQFQEEISSRFLDGETMEDIAEYLTNEYQYEINSRTIRRRLKEWGIKRRVRTIDKENLDNQIMILFFQCGLSDDDMHSALQKQGCTIGPRALRVRRRRLGLYRQLSTGDFAALEASIREAVQKELDKGIIESYGREYLFTCFCSKQHIVSRNRTGFSVLRQYLDTLKSERRQPRFIRSDGGDTTLLAAAQHALYKKHNENATISDCYWYGTSTSNQRIEAWWSQLTKSCIFRWWDYFQTLNRDRLFEQDQISDRIAILAVYMPFIRDELYKFIRLWNVHTIRKQKNQPSGVFGKPFFLYHYPEDRDAHVYGLLPDDSLLNGLLETGDWNIDKYVPEETLQWC